LFAVNAGRKVGKGDFLRSNSGRYERIFLEEKCISGQKIAVKNGLELILRTPDLAELLQIKKSKSIFIESVRIRLTV
jgi:hypothetical protein